MKDFASGLIGPCTAAITLNVPTTGNDRYVAIKEERQMQIAILKLLTWHYVILNPALATQQYGQRQMISTLFGIFYEASSSGKPNAHNIFPFAYREQLKKASGNEYELLRVVSDLIANMTEQQLAGIHARLTGSKSGSVIDLLL